MNILNKNLCLKGHFIDNNVSYVLIKEVFLSGTAEHPHYKSFAIKQSDLVTYKNGFFVNTYEVIFSILPGFDYRTNEDISCACNWEHPESVK